MFTVLFIAVFQINDNQMSGNAGPPPFDDTRMIIIMTRKETVFTLSLCASSFRCPNFAILMITTKVESQVRSKFSSEIKVSTNKII